MCRWWLSGALVLLPVTLHAQAIRLLPGTPVPGPPRNGLDHAPLRSAENCVAVVAEAEADTTVGPRSSPQPTRLIMPALNAPMSMRGRQYQVRMRVNPLGLVDSAEFSGPKLDSGYRKDWVRALKKQDFRPAVYQGCAVFGWYRVTVTF